MQTILQNNKLLECAADLLKICKKEIQEALQKISYQNYYEKILQKFKAFEKKANQNNINEPKISFAQYALAAHIDEIVINCIDNKKTDWSSRSLQLKFFEEQFAGEGFFERLKKLQEFPNKNIDVLELYYLCLQFGFKGKYRLYDPTNLINIQNELYRQIESIRKTFSDQLSLDSFTKKKNKRNFLDKISIKTSFTTTIVIILISYFLFKFITVYQTHQTIKHIHTAEMLLKTSYTK